MYDLKRKGHEMISAEELSNLIDTAKVAVDNSSFGPMFHYTNELNPMEKQVNQLAVTVFLHVLTALLKDLPSDRV